MLHMVKLMAAAAIAICMISSAAFATEFKCCDCCWDGWEAVDYKDSR